MTGKSRGRGMVLGTPGAKKGYDPAATMRSSEKVLQLDTSTEIRRLSTPDAEHPVTMIDIELIDVHPQVRRYFDPQKLEALRLSIQEDGVRDAVLVRPTESGRYDLVFGERRLRASKLAQLTKIPSIIRALDNKKANELQIQENQLHEQLSAIEQAEAGVALLAGHWDISKEEVCGRLQTYHRHPEAHKDEIEALEPYWNRNMGVTWRTFTVKRVPLIRLPEAIKDGLFMNAYSEAQARALARLDSETQATLLASLPLPELDELSAMTTPKTKKRAPELRSMLAQAQRKAFVGLEGERAERATTLLKELAEILG